MLRNTSVKIVMIVIVMFIISEQSIAQPVTLPMESQYAEVLQRIGLTDIKITYHRPGVKDRKIWDGLVPYEKIWRAGANENTTISFTHDVRINGNDISAGTYGFHTIPGEEEWILIFSNNATSWGSYFYNEEEDALRIQIEPEEAVYTEWLCYGFDALTDSSAIVYLQWENLRIPFTISVDVVPIVIASLKEQLRGYEGFFWEGYYNAAGYLMQQNTELELALEWIEESIKNEKRLSNQYVKLILLRELKRPRTEIDEYEDLVNEVMDQSDESELTSLGFSLVNIVDPKNALRVFNFAYDEYPESWLARYGMGLAYERMGENQSAIEVYQELAEKSDGARKDFLVGKITSLEE